MDSFHFLIAYFVVVVFFGGGGVLFLRKKTLSHVAKSFPGDCDLFTLRQKMDSF